MKRLSLLVAATLLLASCEGGWSEEDRMNFMNYCENEAGPSVQFRKAYCQCRLEQTMKVYPTINSFVENKDSVKLRLAFAKCNQ